ncbi:MAG: tetratricopeptide repeat protein [Candidatus Thorarchaeota archaeon]|nr:MAG: tetratricopeptide repeat protein [Candidatus Thorarchaeota archaeon]
MTLDLIREMILQRRFGEALEEIPKLPDGDRIEGQIYKGIVYSKQKDFEKAVEVVDELLSEEGLNPSQEFTAKVGKILVSLAMKSYLEAFGEVNQCEQILGQMKKSERDKVKRWEGHLLSTQGMLQIISGDQEKAIECYEQAAALFEEADEKYEQLIQVINISWIYRAQGLLDEALEYSNRQFRISEELGERRYLGWSNFNIAFIYFYMGDLDQAEHHAAIGKEIFEELDHEEGLSFMYLVLASVHRSKGEYEQAMSYYQRVLSSYEAAAAESHLLPHSYCVAFRDIGTIYLYQNQLEEAVATLQKGLDLHKARCKFRNTVIDYEITVANLYSVYAKLEMGDTSQLQVHIDDIKQAAERYPWLDVFTKTTEAFILQSKTRAKDKARAQELYEEVIDEKFDYEMELFIQVNLGDLLLDELRQYGEEDVLKELQQVLERISETASKQRSISSLIWLYILQARLAAIEGDAENARFLLDRAHTIAEEKGLDLLTRKVEKQQKLLSSQLEEWKALFIQNSSIQEQIELLHLKEYITDTVTSILEKKFETVRRFSVVHKDLLKKEQKTPGEMCRVGIAQIGMSESGRFLEEFYSESTPGIFNLQEDKVELIKNRVIDLVKEAADNKVNILLFPELSIDLNHQSLHQTILDLASQHKMYIVPGSYHDAKTSRNISSVFGPKGLLWEQVKHTPAIIHYGDNRIEEGIKADKLPQQIIVSDTEYGRIAIAICRDFLDLDLRVELKNSEPPIDIILNPAFTPVTADFKAVHFDSRRSIYAYCFFANIAEFGNSFIYTPERERTEYEIEARKEGLTFKDVDLFKLRSERRRWEKEHSKTRAFIQSTRS